MRLMVRVIWVIVAVVAFCAALPLLLDAAHATFQTYDLVIGLCGTVCAASLAGGARRLARRLQAAARESRGNCPPCGD